MFHIKVIFYMTTNRLNVIAFALWLLESAYGSGSVYFWIRRMWTKSTLQAVGASSSALPLAGLYEDQVNCQVWKHTVDTPRVREKYGMLPKHRIAFLTLYQCIRWENKWQNDFLSSVEGTCLSQRLFLIFISVLLSLHHVYTQSVTSY